jgi:hypothetical protein
LLKQLEKLIKFHVNSQCRCAAASSGLGVRFQMVKHCTCTAINVPQFHHAMFAFPSQSIAIQDFAAVTCLSLPFFQLLTPMT